MAANVYDAIIIGGGHNGLVSGAYFARERRFSDAMTFTRADQS